MGSHEDRLAQLDAELDKNEQDHEREEEKIDPYAYDPDFNPTFDAQAKQRVIEHGGQVLQEEIDGERIIHLLLINFIDYGGNDIRNVFHRQLSDSHPEDWTAFNDAFKVLLRLGYHPKDVLFEIRDHLAVKDREVDEEHLLKSLDEENLSILKEIMAKEYRIKLVEIKGSSRFKR